MFLLISFIKFINKIIFKFIALFNKFVAFNKFYISFVSFVAFMSRTCGFIDEITTFFNRIIYGFFDKNMAFYFDKN